MVGLRIHPRGRAKFVIGWPAKDGWGRAAIYLYLLAGLGLPPTFQDLAYKAPVKLVDRFPPNGCGVFLAESDIPLSEMIGVQPS